MICQRDITLRVRACQKSEVFAYQESIQGSRHALFSQPAALLGRCAALPAGQLW